MHGVKVLSVLTVLAFFSACGGGQQESAAGNEEGAERSAPKQVDKAARDAVETRQALLKLFKFNYLPMAGMARGKVPFDGSVVEKNALRLEQLSGMLADVFAADTRNSGAKTEALDRIWEDSAAFTDKIEAFRANASGLVEVAATGDEATIIPAIKEVGGSCGSCHDDFKKDD